MNQDQSTDIIRTQYPNRHLENVCVYEKGREAGYVSESVLQSPILEHGPGIMVSTGAFEFLIQKTRGMD